VGVNAKTRSNYQERPRVTSLVYEEFLYLLDIFSNLWETHYQGYDLKGDLCSKPKFKEDAHISLTLIGLATKFLFILSYLKESSTQGYQVLVFEMSQVNLSL